MEWLRRSVSTKRLSANNAVLPIAHYLYRRDIPTGFLSHATYRKDRESVRIWLIRSLLKRGIWGSGLDSLLTALRSVIDSHGGEGFPSNELEVAMRTRGKSLTFEEEEFEDLVESKDRSFTLLSLLYPFVDLQNSKFHIDHVFPKSRFSASDCCRQTCLKTTFLSFKTERTASRTCNCSLVRRTRARAIRSRTNGCSRPSTQRRQGRTPNVMT